MAFTVRWEIGKVKKLLKSTTVKDETAKSGRKASRTYTDEPLDMPYPVIKADGPEDMAGAMAAILEQKVPGFHSVRNVLEHINYGLYNSPAGQLRRGFDPKLSPAQTHGLKMYASLVASGMSEYADAVASLTRSGVENAASLLDAMIAAETESDADVDA